MVKLVGITVISKFLERSHGYDSVCGERFIILALFCLLHEGFKSLPWKSSLFPETFLLCLASTISPQTVGPWELYGEVTVSVVQRTKALSPIHFSQRRIGTLANLSFNFNSICIFCTFCPYSLLVPNNMQFKILCRNLCGSLWISLNLLHYCLETKHFAFFSSLFILPLFSYYNDSCI